MSSSSLTAVTGSELGSVSRQNLTSPRSAADPGGLSLAQRIRVHNTLVGCIRAFLQHEGFEEIPVPELTPATGSCEVVDSMFSLDYFGALAFPRQTGQLYLEEVVVSGLDRVYCEGESWRRERRVDKRHLTEFKLIEMEQRGMTLDELCAFQERMLKDVAFNLSAELVGGGNVTRLDRMIRAEHPRLTYREALGILNRRGFSLAFGDDLPSAAEAALVYYCGNLPIHVTHYPESIKFFNMKIDRTDPSVVECVDYILPFAGETWGGSVREYDVEILRRRLYEGTMYRHLMTRAHEFALQRSERVPSHERDALQAALTHRFQQTIRDAFEGYLSLFEDYGHQRAGFGLGVARLLQYVLGLDDIRAAVVFPMNRTRFGGLGQTVEISDLSGTLAG